MRRGTSETPLASPLLVDKAAVLLVRRAKNHPLPDGNERAAWVSMRMFVQLNGWKWSSYPDIDGHGLGGGRTLATTNQPSAVVPLKRDLHVVAGRPAPARLAGGAGPANRVGADLGPRRMARSPGLPRGGMGVVLPVLDETGRATYLQTRYFGHPRRRYENPATALVGVSPRLAEVRVAGRCVDPDAVVVCEGILDALSAAQAGQRAVAVLGVAAPNRAMADQVVQRFPRERLVVAFDGDPASASNSAMLASGQRRALPVETIWYRHVLSDMSPTQRRWSRPRLGRLLQISTTTSSSASSGSVGFGFRTSAHYRIRVLLYAGRPNWDLLATVTPR